MTINGNYVPDQNFYANNRSFHQQYTDASLSTLSEDQNPYHYVLVGSNYNQSLLDDEVGAVNARLVFSKYYADLELAKVFQRNGSLDFQRSYPGYISGDDEPAFQAAASTGIGYIGQLTVGLGTVEQFGGYYNLLSKAFNPNIITSGKYYNNPQNVLSMECGAELAKGGACVSPSKIAFSDGSFSDLGAATDSSGNVTDYLIYYSASGVLTRADYVTTSLNGLTLSASSEIVDSATGISQVYTDKNGDGIWDTLALIGAGVNNLVINLSNTADAISSNATSTFNAALAVYGVGPSASSSEPVNPLSGIGFSIGSQVGEILGENNPLAQVAEGTVLGALGATLQQYAGSDLSQVLHDHGDAIVQNFGDNLGASFQQVGISLVSAQLTNEALHALGINGFGGQLASFAITPGVDAAITYEVNQLFPALNLQAGGSLSPANIAGFFGQELGQEIIAPQTEAAVVLADLGSTVGGDIGFALGGPVGDFIGSFIGDVIGTLIGDLFGRRPRPIPTATVSVVLQLPDAAYAIGAENSTNGGDLNYVVDIANQAANILNGIIDDVVGSVGTVQNTVSPTQIYGLNGSQIYVAFNGQTTNVASGDAAVNVGVLDAIRQTQLVGGNIFAKRALSDSTATDVPTILADLSVASDYTKYRQSWQSINTLLAANPNSALTAGWIVTLQRANELNLDQFNASDFYGGLKGFADSFIGASSTAHYEDLQVGYDGSSVSIGVRTTSLTPETTTDPSTLAAQIYRLYEGILGRAPDPGGMTSQLYQLENGTTLTQEAASFLASSEFATSYQNRFGAPYASATAQQFVDNVIYETILGRAPDSGGEQSALQRISSGTSWAQIAADTSESAEHQADTNAAIQAGLSYSDVSGLGLLSTLAQASVDGRSVSIGNFAATMGYTAQTPGTVSDGNDFSTAAAYGSGVRIDSYDSGTPGGNDILIGSNYDDALIAGTGNNWLDGGAGDDNLSAPSGNAVLLGGDGNDTLDVGSGPSPGTYYLSGGAGNDSLTAHAGVATFVGGTGQDSMTGGSGTNTFVLDPSLSGGSTISGGSGSNTISFERLSQGVTVDLQVDLIYGSTDTYIIFGDTATNIQNLTGGSGNDTLLLNGSGTLNGGAGNDTLTGRAGDDIIEGGPGADVMDGGAGVNTLTYEGSSAGVYVNLATGEAYGGDANGDTFQNFENLTGSAYNDTLGGTAGSNVLNGGAGDDTFLYSGGGDTFIGGDGFDTVDYSTATAGVIVDLQSGGSGGAAAGDSYSSIEKIIGTVYSDTLTASSTGSTFEGGGGNDTFVGGAASDTYILGRGDGSATVSDNNTASNAIQVGPGLSFDDLWFGTAGGSNGYLAVGIRQAGGGLTGDEISVSGNFGAYPLSANNIIKTLSLNGSSSIDISQVTFVTGGTAGDDTLSGAQNAYSFVIGYEGNDTLTSTPNGQLTQDGTIFFGGTGTDYIDASSGNNEFLFERGDGTDFVNVTGGQNTLIFGSTVSASDVIYQVDSGGNLFIGLRSTTNPTLTASQVSDYVEVVGGGVETENTDSGRITYAPTIQTVEAGGTTINLKQAGVTDIIRYTSGGGGIQQPVVLDLKGDGLELSSVAKSDIGTVDGNGVVTRMSWVGPTDGILVTDRDGTGKYNTTADISFVQDKAGATSDLQGLQAWDTNGDGVLNAQDTDWNKLKVWVDANQDGVAETGEVQTLAQAGVSSISLKETASGFDPSTTFDSYYTGTAAITRTDGTTSTAYDVALARQFQDQTTNANTGPESWASLTPNSTIGQFLVSPFDPTTGAGYHPPPPPLTGAAARSGGRGILNTTGSGQMSAQDAALWSDVLNPAPGQLHQTPGTFVGAANLPAIQTSAAFPAGYNELTGRSNSTAATTRSAEPIVLDLANLGLSEISPTSSAVSFDAAHTGQPETVGWVGSGDAILAYDANGDGEVNPATEITFKPDVATAKTALGGLASFDTNANGYLDPGDAGWSKFLVWRDANGNGVSDPGETETLTQAGVAKLSLTPTSTTPDTGDLTTNAVLAQSNAIMTDGTVRTAYDVALGIKGASAPAAATTAPSANATTAASPSTPATPQVRTLAPTSPSATSLGAAGSTTSSAGASTATSVARASEDGPQTPQGAQYAGPNTAGSLGWWSAPSMPVASVLNASSLSASAGGASTPGGLAAPISTTPDAASLQQQQLLRQSLASFSAPTSNASAVWTRQPTLDLMPALAAAASRPALSQSPALAGVGG